MKLIESKDLMHIGFLKKEKYTGSSEGMRYRLERFVKVKDGEQEEICLRAVHWPEPYCYDATEETLRQEAFFSFDEDGVEAARQWLNQAKEGY